MPSDDLVAIIEAAYAVEAPERAWLAGLARNVYEHSGLTTVGAYAQSYCLPPGAAPSFGEIEFVGVEPERMRALHDELGDYYMTRPDRIVATYGETDEGLALSLPGGEPDIIAGILARSGVADMYGINARSPSGKGCLLCVYLAPDHAPIADDRRTAFGRIARHVSTALRLRGRLLRGDGDSAGNGDNADRLGAPRTSSRDPDAIIDATGNIRHAVRGAKEKAALDALRAAAAGLVRARGAHRWSTPERAVAAWKGLVDARWSLVDHFERDGSHYVVAHRNDPMMAPIALLTERERQVVALAALGLANKVIAYELGIATSTVGVLLGRAMTRLGVHSRRELIEAYRAAVRTHPFSADGCDSRDDAAPSPKSGS